ncbi:hypothetical protein F5I97DRAFT_1804323 [Phlebopus sp. FC_14]|nr:hypothetical protein F5I97DRAFT_1804323 [Phlebopus sp. FC_14]
MDPGMSAKSPIQSHTDFLHPHSALYRVDFSSSTQEPDLQNSQFLASLPSHQMDQNGPTNSRYHNTCIPSLMPPGVDPTSVDFRTFFPYIPNEVKHRKRTSRAQLKVLEDVFRKDTKPNAALRKKLANELDMQPRAVQVWFQNRRAKDKHLRKRAHSAADQAKVPSASTQKSPPRDTSPNDSLNSSTATEKPVNSTEDSASSEVQNIDQPSVEPSPVVKVSYSPPLLPTSAPSRWQIQPGAPAENIPPHIRLPIFDQDSDIYSTRRGSLPAIMPSQPNTGPDPPQIPPHYADRRKSMDFSFYRLMHHPFARIAKEKNEALYFPKSPLSPAGTGQPNMTRSPSSIAGAVGQLRSVSHGAYPYPRSLLGHRASEPHVFAPSRSLVPPVPEGGTLQAPHITSRRLSDNRLYAVPSRTLSSPIPGPLPTPDFQFGNPSSASPPNASPMPADIESPVSAHVQANDIAMMQRWSFPQTRESDQDTEDSGSFTGLSRFGSIGSLSGSESSGTSAMYSDVSSCVAVDHMGYERRASCASGNYLEMRMSGLNMRSSQGSISEAHLSPTVTLPYARRDSIVQQEQSSEVIGGYASPTPTASPGGSPHVRHVKDPGPSRLGRESVCNFDPVLCSWLL